jgi:hypothetical protein
LAQNSPARWRKASHSPHGVAARRRIFFHTFITLRNAPSRALPPGDVCILIDSAMRKLTD